MIKIIEQFLNISKGQTIELSTGWSGLVLISKEKMHSVQQLYVSFVHLSPGSKVREGRKHIWLFALITQHLLSSQTHNQCTVNTVNEGGGGEATDSDITESLVGKQQRYLQ